MSDDKIMCIVNAPRIEIVLVPENQAQREGDEVEDDTLLDAVAKDRVLLVGTGRIVVGVFADVPVSEGRRER
jgi:hypothetical protein